MMTLFIVLNNLGRKHVDRQTISVFGIYYSSIYCTMSTRPMAYSSLRVPLLLTRPRSLHRLRHDYLFSMLGAELVTPMLTLPRRSIYASDNYCS